MGDLGGIGGVMNVVSVSGGKDSTATLAVAIAQDVDRLVAVFADTGNEHPLTYEYVDYLSDWLISQGRDPIRIVRADFSEDFERRRAYLTGIVNGEYEDRYGRVRHTKESAAKALEFLQPTGNPFLDLCMLKGKFPGSLSAFCSAELKRTPITEQVVLPLMDQYPMVLSWQGVRREESLRRRYLNECEELGGGVFIYRPILRWAASDVFEAHRVMGLKPNPLYKMGMKRVGCMPCINVGRDELREIADRFPEHIERIAQWEDTVGSVSKRGGSTFISTASGRGNGIWEVVEWSRTRPGGNRKQVQLVPDFDASPSCSSIYGLCE